MSYFDQLTQAMAWLAVQPNTMFLGQSVAYPGNALYKTLKYVPMDRRTEMPVAEDMQMGMSIGLSLAGKVPISIYPRMNFLMCAMNQLVNHLDKMEEYSHGDFCPKVIVRVCVGSTKPLYPGVQHTGDFPLHLDNAKIVRLDKPSGRYIMDSYQDAYLGKRSTVLIEYADLYSEGG